MQDGRTVSIETSRAAGSDTAIVFAGDGFYARAAMQVAQQIDALNPERRFDICIAANDMPEAPPDSLSHLNLRRCAIRTHGLFDGLRLDPGRTEIVYLRLALPQAFRGEYRRILYLDSDIFVQAAGFDALLTLDLGERAIAAVRDNAQARKPRRTPTPSPPHCADLRLILRRACRRGDERSVWAQLRSQL